MLRIGLTGGIGAGKSTVARELERLGAVVIDADAVAREVVAPGTPGLAAVVAEFGEDVLTPDGALNRPALGRIVFSDPGARARLEALTHPRIAAETARRTAELPAGSVIVHDVPLLVENRLAGNYDLVVVVGADEEVRLVRLIRDRGMAREDALARIRAQADDDDRRAVADVWLDNSGTTEDLLAQVRELWEERVTPLREAGA
ncbi:dephospho-CoA kinase [Georgenia sp. H159]|uniref:dephospho-CoA kinase n=1 Tax=Georgenia sp. H159 TaxID=3076115 RepID=UPI002D772294|nr:dephospho-CoA kinase [Georgenia sp. H159]